MRACRPGATGTRRSATAAASMPATRTATASARCTSIQWRVSGHCSAPGCVRIAASRRRSCQSISASLSSCTTRAGAEKPCSVPLSLLWSGDALHHPGSRQEPSTLPSVRMTAGCAIAPPPATSPCYVKSPATSSPQIVAVKPAFTVGAKRPPGTTTTCSRSSPASLMREPWGVSCLEAAMWTPADRALVGNFGSGQALTDDQFRLLEPLIPLAKPGGRPRTTDLRQLLDGLFYLVRPASQWRHLPPPPAFPPWRTVYGYMRAFLRDGVWESIRH